jgi:hypothetical protein
MLAFFCEKLILKFHQWFMPRKVMINKLSGFDLANRSNLSEDEPGFKT